MDYYEKKYEDYFTKTVSIDPAPFLETFIQIAPHGSRVWDIGCGSGRDLRWLKERGFHAVGLERSAGLASLARIYSDCEVVEADFETFDFSGLNADCMLMTGSLVHLHWDKLQTVLSHIIKGLKPQGVIYISLKKGQENSCLQNTNLTKREKQPTTIEEEKNLREVDSKRVFYMWSPKLLEQIFHQLSLEVINFSERASMLKTGEIWLGYLMRKTESDQFYSLASPSAKLRANP